MGAAALEGADIFRAHGPALRVSQRSHRSLGQLKVMSAIEQCRTAALGGTLGSYRCATRCACTGGNPTNLKISSPSWKAEAAAQIAQRSIAFVLLRGKSMDR